MDLIKEVLAIVTLPPSLVIILKWLVGMLLIDRALEKLTKSKLSLEKIVKVALVEVRNSLQLRDGIQPLKINRKIKKFFSYGLCGAWGYGCLVFSALLISSFLMLLLRKNTLTLDKTLLAWGIIIIFGWAARFAYVETRIAFKNAKSI